MHTEYASPIQYQLDVENEPLAMNSLLGKKLAIRFLRYQCLECGKEKEIYAMGCCRNCFFTSPYTGSWVVRPELSTAHLGQADRNLEIEAEIQLQPHIVYLANSGGIKVGVTRKTQVPTRWIDQGAEYAIQLAETENRYQAGLIEAALKQHMADKTNYRKMLGSTAPFEDLSLRKKEIVELIPQELQSFVLNNDEITQLKYPVERYPSKVKSVNLSKKPELEAVLTGIKGQYLIFDTNEVLNIRSHEGFVVELRTE